MTLMRVVMAKARCRGGGTISYKHAVGADADLELVLERLEVQVAGVVLDGQQQHHVQQLAHRGAVGQGLDAGQVDAPRRFSMAYRRHGQLGVLLHVGDQRLHALAAGRVVALQRLEHVLLGADHRLDVVAQKGPQLVEDRELLRIAHGDRQRVVLEARAG